MIGRAKIMNAVAQIMFAHSVLWALPQKYLQ